MAVGEIENHRVTEGTEDAQRRRQAMEWGVLIGYFPKKVMERPEWLRVPGVKTIRSVSDCMSSGPDDWINKWAHNEMWVYSSIATALSVVPEGERGEYEIHAYRMLAARWDEGREIEISISEIKTEPLTGAFENIGFDVVSIENGVAGFGHSPLSCNRMAEEIATNEHCLLDDLETAKRTAMQFSQGKVEPGPYYVVQVFRKPK